MYKAAYYLHYMFVLLFERCWIIAAKIGLAEIQTKHTSCLTVILSWPLWFLWCSTVTTIHLLWGKMCLCVCMCVSTCCCISHAWDFFQSIWTSGACSNVTPGSRSVLQHIIHRTHRQRTQTDVCEDVLLCVSLFLCHTHTNTHTQSKGDVTERRAKEKLMWELPHSICSEFSSAHLNLSFELCSGEKTASFHRSGLHQPTKRGLELCYDEKMNLIHRY